ncbi:outer dynein arm-docking complex subunit 3-like [Nelusetta ayraudi]|uniref:outer dynein arm-docking complex subunit 3-like n=1 Tax=Nelusetta ayraudi TaxID=303726 RepID=UPI003F6F48E1
MSSSSRGPQHDPVVELQRKIQLLEGDNAANYEKIQAIILKNLETVRQLRQENKTLNERLAEANAGDERLIREAFGNRGAEIEAYRSMSGKVAMETLDKKVLSKRKILNALKHDTQIQLCQLEELQQEFQRLQREDGSGKVEDKKEQEAMKLRSLEHSLEKKQFKCKEAENIITNDEKLKSHLQEESLTYQGHLDKLQADILKARDESFNIQLKAQEAEFARDQAKTELQQQESLLYKERKERERILISYRKQVEEHKARAERANRRRAAMQTAELSGQAQSSSPSIASEEEKLAPSAEEALKEIKEATGAKNKEEIVRRFSSQKETRQLYLRLEEDNEKVLQQLKEQMDLLNAELQDLRITGETNRSRDKLTLEEREQQMQLQQQRLDASKRRWDELAKILSKVRGRVEHLSDKLQNVPLTEDTETELTSDSDEYVLVLLSQCEQKLQSLNEELVGNDLPAILKEMEQEEFYISINEKPAAYNTRIKLPEDQPVDFSSDESDEEEAEIITRETLKRQSQVMIESKSKKKKRRKCNF